MRHLRWTLPLFLAVVGCKPTNTVPVRLVLTASEVPLEWGARQTVTARAFVGTKSTNIDGLTWSSADETIVTATPGAEGEVELHGVGEGSTTVTASLKEATATITVTVAARIIVLERIEVTSDSLTVAKGLRTQLRATGHYNDGSTKDLASTVAWASADSTRATVSGTGLVTAIAVGTVELRALKSGVVGTVQLTVTDATLTAIDVRPATTSLALGTTQAFTATGRLSDATTQNLTAMVTWATSAPSVLSVDSMGRAKALQLGTSDLTATFMGVTGTAAVTVTDATLRSLDATPSALTIPLGTSQQIALSGLFSDGTMQDLTSEATWRSGTLAVATVDDGGVVTAVGQGLSVVTANVGAISTTASVTVVAPQLSAIQVTPQSPQVPLGTTRSFAATGVYTDRSTRDLTNTVTWSTSDAGVATISNTAPEIGLLRTVTEGNVVVSASNGTLTGSSAVSVGSAILVSMVLNPATLTLPAGRSALLTADGRFSDGTNRPVNALASWSSDDAGVAVVSNDAGLEGLVTGVAPGQALITASSGLISATRSVTIGPAVLDRLDLTAPTTSLAKGRRTQLTATGTFSDQSTQNLTASTTWTVDGGATTVSSTGEVFAAQVGTALINGTSSSVSGALGFTVTPAEIDSIAVTPALPVLPLGRPQTFTATATLSDGTPQVLSTGVTWEIADPTVGAVSSAGVFTSLAQGQTVIRALFDGGMGSTSITVGAPVLARIDIAPNPVTLEKGESKPLTANGTLTDGTPRDVTSTATWSSSAPVVVSVSDAGVVLGVMPGVVTITAVQDGVTVTVPVTVNRPQLQSLTVSPTMPSLIRGHPLSFSVLATYVDASTEVVTSLVTWTSSDPAVATIDATGVAQGVGAGSTTITATWGSISDFTTLSVSEPTLVSIAVTGSTRFALNTATPFVATGTYDDASTSNITSSVTWDSSSPLTVRFSSLAGVQGVGFGMLAGDSLITATLGGVTSPPLTVRVLTTVPYAGRCGTGLVISQIYGGGGNSGATLRNDFVELHNASSGPISLQGLSLQYASSTGTSWTNNVPLANVSVPAGSYYTVMMATGGSAGAVFTGDQNAININMSATAGKVALVSGTSNLSGACPTANVIDFVGFGTGTNCSEGTIAPPGSTSAGLERGANGCRDGHANSVDFTATTPSPRTLSSTALLCVCSANGLATAQEVNACQLLGAASVTATANDVSPAIGTSVTQPGVTELAGFASNVRVQVGFGPVTDNPTTATSWQWWPAKGTTAGAPADTYQGVFVSPASGNFSFTTRVSLDGTHWTTCDLNGAGSSVGLSFETSQLGALTVP